MMKAPHYGWVIVAASVVILAILGLILFTFGIFLEPITEELNWDRGALSAAFSISFLAGGFLGIIAGRLSDRFGPRPLVTITAISAGSGFLLLSQINSLWQAYLILTKDLVILKNILSNGYNQLRFYLHLFLLIKT